MSTWADLRELRRQGLRPRLPVCIASNFQTCRKQAEAGAMVIVHKTGERFHTDLLRGLDVEFYLECCDHVSRAFRLMNERGHMPATMKSFCVCEQFLDSSWWPSCRLGIEFSMDWDELVSKEVASRYSGRSLYGR